MELENLYSGWVGKRPVQIVSGKGALLYDAQGKEYIDCIGGNGVAITGHCHPKIVQAINDLVKKLGLTHPQMAKPLFHIWNIILKEIELEKWGRFWDNIKYIIYNGKKVFLKAEGCKGWQISIFQDDVRGRPRRVSSRAA